MITRDYATLVRVEYGSVIGIRQEIVVEYGTKWPVDQAVLIFL